MYMPSHPATLPPSRPCPPLQSLCSANQGRTDRRLNMCMLIDRISDQWEGVIAINFNDVPIVQEDPRRKGLFQAAVYCGHGVCMSNFVGTLLTPLLLQRIRETRMLPSGGEDGGMAAGMAVWRWPSGASSSLVRADRLWHQRMQEALGQRGAATSSGPFRHDLLRNTVWPHIPVGGWRVAVDCTYINALRLADAATNVLCINPRHRGALPPGRGRCFGLGEAISWCWWRSGGYGAAAVTVAALTSISYLVAAYAM